MGKLNLLHHKSYHPYSAENIAKVQRDEAVARGIEEEVDRKSGVAVESPLALLLCFGIHTLEEIVLETDAGRTVHAAIVGL